MKPSRCSIFALWSCAYAVGCTHQVRPDDMSVEAHLAAAEKENRQAQREMASATLDSPARDPLNPGVEPELYISPDATPGLAFDRVEHARYLAERAREHEQAAAELERYEEAECKTVPPAQRITCPSLGPISEIRDIDDGARVRLSESTRAAEILPDMRCHYAYARAHGWTGNPECALYVRGIEFRETPDPWAIEFVGHDSKAVAEVRKRIHAAALGPATASER